MKINKIKKFITLFTVITIILGTCSGIGLSQETLNYSLGAGSLGGSLYVLSAGLVGIWAKDIPELNLAVEAAGGSLNIINLMERNRLEFAFLEGPAMVFATEGIGPFEETKPNIDNFKTIFSYPKNGIQVIVDGESDIMKISDLKGKSINIGAMGSDATWIIPPMLEDYGVTASNSNFQYLSVTDGTDQLRNGTIDCTIATTLPPMSAISDLAMSRKIRLLDIEGEPLQNLIDFIPGSYSVTFAPDVYGDAQVNEEPITTYGYGNSLITLLEDEELIYRITKSTWENIDDVHAISAMASRITEDTVFDAQVLPLHPGAERYYKEVGMLEE